MTWKSYAAMSGAGLLATYLVSAPPATEPGRSAQPRTPVTRQEAPADIAHEAERLQTRTRVDSTYEEPSRNPFRFGARPARAAAQEAAPPAPVVAPPLEAPQPPPIRVAGIATEMVQGQRQRSAVLITSSGVTTVREGDSVPPDYRVARIDDSAVELTAADGSSRRIPLRP